MIFDGHSDIFTDVLRRRLQGERQVLQRYHLPLLRRGGITAACLVLWVDPPYTATPAARLEQLLTAVEAEMAECSEAVIVRNVEEWTAAETAGRFAIFLGMEGLSAIGEDVDAIDRLYEFGVRHAMLTWNEQNALATGVGGDPLRGITDVGRRVLQRMTALGMVVDVSHLNDASFWDVLSFADGPVIASHSNARALVNVPRNLSDDQLRAIAASGGVVGLNAFKNFVAADAAAQDLDHFAAHALHIADTIGVAHLALGFDFNEYLSNDAMKSYNDAANPNIQGLQNCSRVPDFIAKLHAVGFSSTEIQQICWKNWLRVIDDVIG